MRMRLIEEVVTRPNHCVVMPHMGAHHERGYVDTGAICYGVDPHIVISVIAAEEIGAVIGMVPREDHTQLQAEAEQLRLQVAELQEKLDGEEAFRRAVDVIESADYRARRRQGRPNKPKAEKAVA